MQGYRRQELKCHFAAHKGAAFLPIGASIFELRPMHSGNQFIRNAFCLLEIRQSCYILLAQETEPKWTWWLQDGGANNKSKTFY